MTYLLNALTERAGEFIRLRRDIHRHPELGFEEVYTAARVQEARELPRRIVSHQDLHVVAATTKCGGLVLRMLDDSAPVRPRERNDDANLQTGAPAKALARRAAPISIASSLTASESRTQPAPLGPKPSPGAAAMR